MKQLFELFISFFKIGLFTFGGGYAMLSIIDYTCVEQKKWITHEDMLNITVIAESTPGPVAINCSTFVGYRQKGLCGAFFATLGMILPSFFIIFFLSMFFDRFLEIEWVAKAFGGIKIAVGILIVDAALKMLKKMKKEPLTIGILVCAFIIMMAVNIFALNISSIILMLAAASVSLCMFLIGCSGRKEK